MPDASELYLNNHCFLIELYLPDGLYVFSGIDISVPKQAATPPDSLFTGDPPYGGGGFAGYGGAGSF